MALQNKLDAFYTIMNQEMEVTSDAAVYNPHLDSDPDMNDQYSDDVMDGQISDSEADRDRLMINYTEHFDPSIRSTSDDIREELEEEFEECSLLKTCGLLCLSVLVYVTCARSVVAMFSYDFTYSPRPC